MNDTADAAATYYATRRDVFTAACHLDATFDIRTSKVTGRTTVVHMYRGVYVSEAQLAELGAELTRLGDHRAQRAAIRRWWGGR